MSVSAAPAPAPPTTLRSLPRLRAGAPAYAALVAAAVALAAASLLFPSAPAYDPWAWIIWGREIAHLELHTLGGPTWKPLPVLITTLLTPFGGAAPALWLLLARAGGLLALMLAALLAFRALAGRPRAAILAAVLSAGGLVVLPGLADSILGGESEGLLAALCLAVLVFELEGRPRWALWAAFAATLIRPETWLFFALYAGYAWRRDRSAGWLITAQAVAIPLLWFVPDLIGSASLFRGVRWAEFPKAGSPALAHCPFCSELSGEAWPLLGAPFKAGVGLAVAAIAWGALRGRGRRLTLCLLGLGLAWVLEEGVFTQAGFSGSDRYLLAPVALLTVAAAIGWASARRRTLVAGGLALSAALAFLGSWPGPHLGRAIAGVRYQARLADALHRAVAEAGGRERLLACGPLQTNASEVPLVAWTLDAPLRSAESLGGAVIVRSANGPHTQILPTVPPGYRELVRVGAVTVWSRCRA